MCISLNISEKMSLGIWVSAWRGPIHQNRSRVIWMHYKFKYSNITASTMKNWELGILPSATYLKKGGGQPSKGLFAAAWTMSPIIRFNMVLKYDGRRQSFPLDSTAQSKCTAVGVKHQNWTNANTAYCDSGRAYSIESALATCTHQATNLHLIRWHLHVKKSNWPNLLRLQLHLINLTNTNKAQLDTTRHSDLNLLRHSWIQQSPHILVLLNADNA